MIVQNGTINIFSIQQLWHITEIMCLRSRQIVSFPHYYTVCDLMDWKPTDWDAVLDSPPFLGLTVKVKKWCCCCFQNLSHKVIFPNKIEKAYGQNSCQIFPV